MTSSAKKSQRSTTSPEIIVERRQTIAVISPGNGEHSMVVAAMIAAGNELENLRLGQDDHIVFEIDDHTIDVTATPKTVNVAEPIDEISRY